MQFLYPSFLWALLALAIPVIIHLFYFRRFKKVYFTNVRFLKEVKEETSARRKVRDLLVLLSRMAALAALVFAFAQPFLPKDTEVRQGQKVVSVFVDNSYSMSALSEDVPLLQKAKQRAREIIEAYQVDDEFQILTNDFEGRHQRLLSQEDALAMIEEIEVRPAVRSLAQVVERQKQVLNTGTTNNKVSYILSDFQQNITDLTPQNDTTLEINLLPLQSVQEKNVSIDSCWFQAPVQMLNQANTLLIKVRNYSNQEAENVRLTLQHEGQVKPVGTLSIPPNASVVDTVNVSILRKGWHEAILKITDYPVQFDDELFFTFYVPEQINVLVINEATPNKYLEAAFTGISYFNVTNSSSKSLDYSSFSDYNLIIANNLKSVSSGLSNELSQYMANGGNLLVFPGVNADTKSYKAFLNSLPANELQGFETEKRTVADVNTEEFIFNDVFENKSSNLQLPVTQGNYKLTSYSSRGEERLLIYRDGSTFLSKYTLGQGHLYLCAAPLETEFNNLVSNGEIFVPMLYKMAISTAKKRKIAYTIGQDEILEVDRRGAGSETVYKLKGSEEEFIPEQRIIANKVVLGLNEQVTEAGFYNLFLNPENTLEQFGFNFDRKESDLAYIPAADLTERLDDSYKLLDLNTISTLTPLIGERSQGVQLWKWCIIAALIFLGLESLFLRLWKV